MSNEQSAFDFLVPYRKPLLRPDEAATCLGRSVDFVYDMLDEGKLESHAPKNREVRRYTITRRSVVLLLAETATYDPEHFTTRAEALLETLSADQLTRVIRRATELRIKQQQSR